MGREDLKKFIINMLCQHYDYNIEEFPSMEGKDTYWGLSKVTGQSKEYIVFMDEKNFHNLDTSFLYDDYNNEVIKVLFIDKESRNDSKWYILAEDDEHFSREVIVIDEYTNKVLYNSMKAGLVAAQIDSIIRYRQEVKNEKKKNKLSIITVSLIAANVIMYIITAFLSGNILDSNINALIYLGAKENSLIASGQYYRLITAMFLHGGIVHLVLNMYSLKAIGPLVEKVYGKAKYIAIYFIGGIVSSMFSYKFSDGVSIGASGAIFALLGATLVFAMKMRDRIGKGMVINILSVIGINIFIGIAIPNIDNFGHLGGLIGGFIVSLLISNNFEKTLK